MSIETIKTELNFLQQAYNREICFEAAMKIRTEYFKIHDILNEVDNGAYDKCFFVNKDFFAYKYSCYSYKCNENGTSNFVKFVSAQFKLSLLSWIKNEIKSTSQHLYLVNRRYSDTNVIHSCDMKGKIIFISDTDEHNKFLTFTL